MPYPVEDKERVSFTINSVIFFCWELTLFFGFVQPVRVWIVNTYETWEYCKVRNINVEVILATLTSGSDSLILRSVNICSF